VTTFEAIVLSVVRGLTEFLPLGATGHQFLFPYIWNWSQPEGAMAGAMALGAFLSVLIYFRHDWASMISSLIQVILFRKRPVSIDERMPLFVIVALIPSVAGWHYLREPLSQVPWTPLVTAGVLAACAIPMWISESFSRKNKGMYDWNWFDSLAIGFSMVAMLVPGVGRLSAGLVGALFRNYNREASAKFTYFMMMPLLLGSAIFQLHGLNLHAAQPMPDTSWLSFGLAILITMTVGLIAISAFMKQLQRGTLGRYISYRILFGVAMTGLWFYRNRV
jgi:undecaprenyl-diphosphatase